MVLEKSEVTFVYIGAKLPSYAKKSLELASKFSGQRIKIIGSTSIYKSIKENRFDYIALEDFYSSEEFFEASKFLSGDSRFRNGIWSKSLERFFVLDQYMRFDNVEKFFHAELDQILFRTDILESRLTESQYKGIFFPFHGPSAVVASVVFCNDNATLRSFLDFASSGLRFLNEMQMLAAWAKINPNSIFELPTAASEIESRTKSLIPGARLLNISEAGGLVDPAQLGQWAAGIDPRNVPIFQYPANKFIDEGEKYTLSRDQITQIKFAFNSNSNLLEISYKEELLFRVFNLHLHSKIHSTGMLTISGIKEFFTLINLSYPVRFRGTRRVQIMDYFLSNALNFMRSPIRSLIFVFRKIFLKV
jgi:hypothetical protein